MLPPSLFADIYYSLANNADVKSMYKGVFAVKLNQELPDVEHF